jgi:hypothetical protein
MPGLSLTDWVSPPLKPLLFRTDHRLLGCKQGKDAQMRFRKLIPILIAIGLLAIGIGATVAIADDGGPEGSPEACVVVPPASAPANAANAVTAAAGDVSKEADNPQGDDEQGDAQSAQGDDQDQGDEQGDCNEQDDDSQGG